MIYTLWSLLEAAVEAGSSHGLAGIEQALGSPLQIHEERENWVFYRATAPAMSDGIQLSDVRVTLHKDVGRIGASFELAGRCIGRDEIKAHYPALRFELAPSNPSAPAAPAYWSVQVQGFPVWFGFRNDNPDCLSSVSIRVDRRKAP